MWVWGGFFKKFIIKARVICVIHILKLLYGDFPQKGGSSSKSSASGLMGQEHITGLKKKSKLSFSSRKDKSSKSNSVIFLNATFTLKMCLVCSKQMLLLSLNYVIAYSLLLQLSQETCYTFKTKTHSNSNNIKDINIHVCIPGSCEQGLENWNISSFYRFHIYSKLIIKKQQHQTVFKALNKMTQK